MAEKKHTKEEILEILDCELKNNNRGLYILIHENETYAEFYSNMLWTLNKGYYFSKKHLKLLIELMDILEKEEKQQHNI